MSLQIHPYYYRKSNRYFDIIASIFSIIICIPIWIIVIPIIAFGSGYPIIFKQKRTGLNKKSFIIYKLRTMKLNAHKIKYKYKSINQAPEPMFKIYDDPRFTKIGKFISKLGIDETPQFFNILKGDMSFIGPRPLPTNEANKLPPSWDFRYKVKPGLFSEWTLSPDRHSSLKKWMSLEKKTLKNGGFIYSIKLIFQIIFQQLKLI